MQTKTMIETLRSTHLPLGQDFVGRVADRLEHLDGNGKTFVPLAKLHASEAQTLRLWSLVHRLTKLLREAQVDGAAALLEQAAALEAGSDIPGVE